jgi:prepilin-type N-terminal cleavage/methylation domain-containing protein
MHHFVYNGLVIGKGIFCERSPKKGITLVELLIVIALISIISAILSKMRMPGKADLEKKGPKEAIEILVQSARKITYSTGEEIHIQFIDQEMKIVLDQPVLINSGNLIMPSFPFLNEKNNVRKHSVEEFLKQVTDPNKGDNVTITPLLILTDKDGTVIFDEDQLCYAMIQNPSGKQIAINNVFEEGYIDSNGHWQNRKMGGSSQIISRNYFTVYPSGLCDQVSFKAAKYQPYNRNFVVDSFSGLVTDIP